MSHSGFYFALSRSRCQADWINKATNRSSHLSRGIHNGVSAFFSIIFYTWLLGQFGFRGKDKGNTGVTAGISALRQSGITAQQHLKEFILGGLGLSISVVPIAARRHILLLGIALLGTNDTHFMF